MTTRQASVQKPNPSSCTTQPESFAMQLNAPGQLAIAHRLDPQVRQMANRLPGAVVNKLSESELTALYQSISRPRRPEIDVRLSLPLLSNRLYFVTLVGLERRQKAAPVQHRNPWSLRGFGLAMALSLLSGFTIGGVGYRMLNQQAQLANANATAEQASGLEKNAADPIATPRFAQASRSAQASIPAEINGLAVHPTALPWVRNAKDCDGLSRDWINGFCYEQAHNPSF